MATVVVLAVVVLVSAAAVGATLVAAAVSARHRAGTAADFAALAAAGQALSGRAVACRAARESAVANGGRLTQCELRGAVAEVRVAVSLPGPLARWAAPAVTARAGPVSPPAGTGVPGGCAGTAPYRCVTCEERGRLPSAAAC
jgi:secretion/DNA translocation related TadE-like protein